jgi:hypothetical protein
MDLPGKVGGWCDKDFSPRWVLGNQAFAYGGPKITSPELFHNRLRPFHDYF